MTGAITTNSTFDGVDIATRDGVLTSTTATAAAALPKAGGAMTGAITTNSTFDGRDVATDGAKLDGIEASATADQTASQIKTLLEDGIDSVHYVDGSIDLAHISSQAVDEDNLYISNAGSNGQFLSKQSGNNGGLTWATVSSEDFIPNGSVMVFFQSAAPTGWTKVTTQNDKTLRVVSGNGGGTGGDWAMSAGETTSSHAGHVHTGAAHTHNSTAHTHAGGNLAAASHTLSTAELASHGHGYVSGTGNAQAFNSGSNANSSRSIGNNNATTANAGSGSAHSHGMSGNTGSTTPGATGSTTPGNSGSAGSHTHTIEAPQYIDVIICSKDA